MRLLHHRSPAAPRGERGAVLLLSFLVLMVIIAIVYQLNRVTATDQQVANRDFTSTNMDLAIESALLEIQEQLRSDGELKLGADDAGAVAEPGSGDPGAGEDNPDATDSFMDEWAQQAATSINDLEIGILIVDEDRKYNILNVLAEDPDEAQDAFDRVVRILDLCREDTEADISQSEAYDMAQVIREHLQDRDNSFLPRPGELLSFDENNRSMGMPLSIREFIVLEPFTEDHFRDSFDWRGNRVHSVDAFLTVYTSPTVGDPDSPDLATSEGGYGVNVNTAPRAVLTALLDAGELNPSFWEDVVEYRNLEEEEVEDEESFEPMLDEFGEEILLTQIFDSLDELKDVRSYDMVVSEVRERLKTLLRVDSDVFSVYVTARQITLAERHQTMEFGSRREQEEYERSGAHMTRTVRAVFWRRALEDEVVLVPLVRWEVLDSAPLPILDYPDEDGW